MAIWRNTPYCFETANLDASVPSVTRDRDLLRVFLHEFMHCWADDYVTEATQSTEIDQHNSLCSGHAEKSCIFRYGNEDLINLNFVKTGMPVCDMHKLIMLNRMLR